jgi:hypothetical protein
MISEFDRDLLTRFRLAVRNFRDHEIAEFGECEPELAEKKATAILGQDMGLRDDDLPNLYFKLTYLDAQEPKDAEPEPAPIHAILPRPVAAEDYFPPSQRRRRLHPRHR